MGGHCRPQSNSFLLEKYWSLSNCGIPSPFSPTDSAWAASYLHGHISSGEESHKLFTTFQASVLLFSLEGEVSLSPRFWILLSLLTLGTWVYTFALVFLEYTEFTFPSDEEGLKKTLPWGNGRPLRGFCSQSAFWCFRNYLHAQILAFLKTIPHLFHNLSFNTLNSVNMPNTIGLYTINSWIVWDVDSIWT